LASEGGPILHHDEIVIGGNLKALMFAYVHQLPLYFTRAQVPFRFDYFDPQLTLKNIGIPTDNQIMTTPTSSFEVGIRKELLWERLAFLLSLDGLLPLGNLCDTIRYDETKIVCSSEYAKIHELDFDKCHYFGDPNTFGISIEEGAEDGAYTCYDYIAFHKGGKHEIDYLSTNDDFVGEIWFYSSDRIDGNTGVKDACVVSTLTKSQLNDPDYSEIIARFKMEKTLYDNGMRGPLNGYTPTGKPKHYRFKTSNISRVKYVNNLHQCRLDPKICNNNLTEDELLALVARRDLSTYRALRCDYTLPV